MSAEKDITISSSGDAAASSTPTTDEVDSMTDSAPESSSDRPAPAKKVCFICGSYTSLTINIYEPRAGPNIIDVINAKFKVPPLNDDKFLCYSCNNWLINWHSVQNKSDDATSSTPSSSPAAGCKDMNNQSGSGVNNTRRSTTIRRRPLEPHNHRNAHAVTMHQHQSSPAASATLHSTSSTDDDASRLSECDTNDAHYFGGCQQTLELRAKLAKYLYRPKTTIAGAVPPVNNAPDEPTVVTITKVARDAPRPVARIQRTTVRQRVACTTPIECNMCGKPMLLKIRRFPVAAAVFLSRRCVRFCRNCRRAMHKYYFGEVTERRADAAVTAPSSSSSPDDRDAHHVMVVDPLAELAANESATAGSLPTATAVVTSSVQSKSKVVNPYVLSRLQKLGTTVVREGDEAMHDQCMTATLQHLQTSSPLLFSSLSCSSPFARHQHHQQQQQPQHPPAALSEIQSWPSERNEKNEIVLAFDRTLKEVFPTTASGRVAFDQQQQSSVITTTTTSTDVFMDPMDVKYGFIDVDRNALVTSTAAKALPVDDDDVLMVDDIYSRIPKSLSITLLSAV